MTRISFYHFWLAGLSVFVLAAGSGCDDQYGVMPAYFPNEVDTVTLYALTNTDIQLASAYDVAFETIRWTHLGNAFDFAFEMDPAGAATIMPASVLGIATEAGVAMSERSFDDLDAAPDDGYSVDSALTVSTGDVFVGRSRRTSGDGMGTGYCSYLGSLPRYGKFRVLGLDLQNRTITLQTLVNRNCGYRSLEPGIPTN